MQKWGEWLSIKNIGLFFLVLVLLVVGMLSSNGYETWLKEEQKTGVENILLIYKDSTEELIKTRIDLVNGLERFVLSRNDSEIVKDFPVFAPGLHNNLSGVRNVGIAPQGVLSLIYPLRGNEQAINYNILADPNPTVKAEMDRAIATGKVVVSDPFQLRQGGIGITGRKVIYKQSGLWGLVSVVIDVPVIVELSGLEKGEENLDLAIKDKTGKVFWGNAEIFEQNPVIVKIDMIDGYWELGGVTQGGWPSQLRDSVTIFRAVLFVIGLLIWLLANALLSKKTGLVIAEGKISERTRSLRIVFIYIFLSLAWIFLSDRAVAAIFTNPELINNLQTIKGFFFVLISAMILYWLIEIHYGRYLVTSRALRSIIQGNRLLMRAKSEKELYQGLCQELVSSAGYDMVWMGLADENKRKLYPVAMAGDFQDFFKDAGFEEDEIGLEFPGKVAIKQAAPVVINDISEVDEYPEWRLASEKQNFRSMMALPLVDREVPVGVLSIYSSRKNAFTYGDLELLTSFANDLVFGLRIMKFNKLLTSQKQRFEAILRELGDAVFVTDEKGRIKIVNKALEKLTGEKESVLTNKNHTVIRLIYDKKGNTGRGLVDEILKKGVVVTPKESMSLISSEGKKVAIDLVGTPLKDEKGKVAGSVVILRDVTGQRKTERLKTDFVSLASHQLRSPLTGIKWFVELLLEGAEKMKPQKAKEYIEKIGESNEKLIDLVNDLLVTSRIEEGKYDDRKIVKVGVKDILDEAYGSVGRMFVNKKIKLKGVDDISKEHTIEADRIQIVQVFTNLLSNAAAYSPSGSKVTVKTEKTDGNLLVSVKDEGMGIPKDQQKKIFEKFFRADNVAKKMSGTGLGLYMAKSIVEGHGGEIWFESKEDEGTTFFVKLLIKQKKDG